MKLKAKKVSVWCKEKPTLLTGCPDGWALGKRVRNKVTHYSGKVTRFPKTVVCPDCKKKFKPRIRECHDPNCWHSYLPAHKKTIKVNK